MSKISTIDHLIQIVHSIDGYLYGLSISEYIFHNRLNNTLPIHVCIPHSITTGSSSSAMEMFIRLLKSIIGVNIVIDNKSGLGSHTIYLNNLIVHITHIQPKIYVDIDMLKYTRNSISIMYDSREFKNKYQPSTIQQILYNINKKQFNVVLSIRDHEIDTHRTDLIKTIMKYENNGYTNLYKKSIQTYQDILYDLTLISGDICVNNKLENETKSESELNSSIEDGLKAELPDELKADADFASGNKIKDKLKDDKLYKIPNATSLQDLSELSEVTDDKCLICDEAFQVDTKICVMQCCGIFYCMSCIEQDYQFRNMCPNCNHTYIIYVDDGDRTIL